MTGKPPQLRELGEMTGIFGGWNIEGSVDSIEHEQIRRNVHADPAFVATTIMKRETVKTPCSPKVKTCVLLLQRAVKISWTFH